MYGGFLPMSINVAMPNYAVKCVIKKFGTIFVYARTYNNKGLTSAVTTAWKLVSMAKHAKD